MRKDVLIARITFIILCLAVVGIIVSAASRISASRKDKQKDQQNQAEIQTEADTEQTSEIVENTEEVEPIEPVVVYVKTTKSVNLRKEASTESDVLKTLEAEQTLELVSESDGWAQVIAGEDTGYVSMDFLEYVQAAEAGADPVTGSSTVLKVTTSSIRMRTGAGTDYDILMTIAEGVTLEILEEADGWAKVTYQGQTGFVSADYLQ